MEADLTKTQNQDDAHAIHPAQRAAPESRSEGAEEAEELTERLGE